MRKKTTTLALIGHGAIAREIVRCLAPQEAITIAGALVLPHELDQATPYKLVADVEELHKWPVDLVVECAGHEAVKSYVPGLLQAGLDVMIISIGALADDGLYAEIKAAAATSDAQIFLPPGALIGVDGLAAARRAGLDRVTLTSTKPPLAWSGAPGVHGLDLAAITEKTVIFSGNARAAAQLFPKNANVAATTALAGLGFEATEVRLVADPHATRNAHVLEFEGKPGHYQVVTAGLPSPDNPKTSMLTAFNIVRMIEQRIAALVI